MLKKLSLLTLVLSIVVLSPTYAHANFFNDATSWVKDRYDDARKTTESIAEAAEKATRDIKKSAEYINAQTIKETKILSEQASKGIQDAANYMGDLIKQLGQMNDTCQSALEDFESKGDAFMKGMPHLPHNLQSYSGVPQQLFSNTCEKYAVNGFTCGIFPYLDSIASAIATGAADTKKLAQYVDHAYKSSACNRINPVDRPMCALIVGIARSTEDAYGCTANVIADIVGSGGPNQTSMPSVDVKEVCTMIGEQTFSFAANRLALGATENEDMKKLIKFAQRLKLALHAQEAVTSSDRVKDVCENGAKSTSSGKKSYTAPIPTDTYADVISDNPGKDLVLLKDLGSNMCLDGYGAPINTDRPVQIYGCHGQSNQRWSFHKVDHVDGNYFYIVNERYKTCIEETPKGLVLKTCDQTRKQQLFTPRHAAKKVKEIQPGKGAIEKTVMKRTGTLQNLGTKHCIGLNTKTLKNEMQLKGYNCNDKNLNAVWYVNDPARHLLKQHPGAHLSVYAFPAKPLCMDMRGNHVNLEGCDGNSTQSWSFHRIKDKRGEFDQLWNDHGGPRTCLHNSGPLGAPLTVAPCNSNYNEQLFTIKSDGRMQNLHTGGCVDVSGEVDKIGQTITSWHCDESKAQVWYKTEKK